MSETVYAANADWRERPRGRGRLFDNGFEIAAMVLGFVFFWPAGLALLFYFMMRRRGGCNWRNSAMAAEWRGHWRDHMRNGPFASFSAGSGNAAFDEYRVEMLKRLDEERRKLDEEQMAFRAFVEKLRRAKDQEEFDRFMRERNQPSAGDHTTQG